MKNIENIQLLWSYCSYCNICKKNCRDISVIIGPRPSFLAVSDIFLLMSFKKTKKFLKLKIKTDKDTIILKVNCDENTYKSNKLFKHKFFFYLHGVCVNCDSYANTLDIDFEDNILKNIGIEQERLLLENSEDKYWISIFYQLNQMLIYKWSLWHETQLKPEDKGIKMPIINFDFSDSEETIKKINKYLLLM